MDDLHFLLVGTNVQMLTVLKRVIAQRKGWQAITCKSFEALKTALFFEECDVVLLSSGISSDEEQAIQMYVLQHYPSIKVIVHYGGGSGLLFNEVQQAFEMDKF
ncbi:hypothetical protein [Flavobacterium sp.]|uniref:hypothetical protein n=1 Tax=Flavobacterium sp. TaxID=239 RepID=UPI0025C1F741|nr:hypothetical protein [Flavobacterium sp.]